MGWRASFESAHYSIHFPLLCTFQFMCSVFVKVLFIRVVNFLSFVCRTSDRVRQLGSMLHSYARQPRSRSPSPPPSLVKCHSPILEPSRSVPLMLYPKYCIVNNFEIFVETVSYRDNLILYYYYAFALFICSSC